MSKSTVNRLPGAPPEFLIVAASARFLAEAAAACGYACSAVDGFADAELRVFARRAVRVPLTRDGLHGAAVREACERLMLERRFAGVVVGAGLDAHPELIEWLSSRLPVCGNAAEVFALCRDRRRFTECLRRLDIPYPAEGDASSVPTLSKFAGASGGAHVGFGAAGISAYRQSYLPGAVVSHLFLAGRGGVASVGWNTQWQSRHDADQPFCYGGAVNRSALGAALRRRTESYAECLAKDLSLAGLNSVDYVVCGDDLYLLELNPRASATVQLHDDEAGTLFAAHLDACRSSAAPAAPQQQAPRAHAVLYAARALSIASGFDWPAGACDLPAGAACLAPGEPLCTLTAAATTATAALTQIQDSIRSLLARFAAAQAGAGGAQFVSSGAAA